MILSNVKIHLGCGAVRLGEWINVDLNSALVDIQLDLTQRMPFADESASYMFCEHFIEHLTRDQAVDFLRECLRVLKPGGVIRISTPNLRFLIAAYLNCDVGVWGDLWQPMTPCSMINEGMHSWGHRYLYDSREIVLLLKEIGFGSVVFQRYRNSLHSDLVALESRPFHHELIVEATKAVDSFIDDYALLSDDYQYWINQHDSIDYFDKKFADQNLCIVEMEAELELVRKELEDQALYIRGLEREMVERDLVIAEFKQSLYEMISSTSWRITSPLRRLAKWVSSFAQSCEH